MKNAGQNPPNRLPWPPMLYVIALVISWILQSMFPLPSLYFPVSLRMIGGGFILIGLVLDLGAMLALYRAKTTILPNRSATSLVTAWPFSISRNPIYLGNTLALAGLSLGLMWPWLLGMTAITAVLVHKLAIEREELHLNDVFGADWRAYRSRVPRWILGI